MTPRPPLFSSVQSSFISRGGLSCCNCGTNKLLNTFPGGCACNSAAQLPHSRTLTAVQDATLEEVVVPAEIVGKCVRYRLDGSKIMKIFLDPKERNNTDYKLETFAAVYRKLSGKDVIFEYPITDA